MTRTALRTVLAAGILVFAWYALSRVASGAADAAPLAMVSAALLVVLLIAVTRKRRTR